MHLTGEVVLVIVYIYFHHVDPAPIFLVSFTLRSFTVAVLDFSRCPESQAYIYCLQLSIPYHDIMAGTRGFNFAPSSTSTLLLGFVGKSCRAKNLSSVIHALDIGGQTGEAPCTSACA